MNVSSILTKSFSFWRLFIEKGCIEIFGVTFFRGFRPRPCNRQWNQKPIQKNSYSRRKLISGLAIESGSRPDPEVLIELMEEQLFFGQVGQRIAIDVKESVHRAARLAGTVVCCPEPWNNLYLNTHAKWQISYKIWVSWCLILQTTSRKINHKKLQSGFKTGKFYNRTIFLYRKI